MSTVSHLDVNSILSPISEEIPAGIDLREDNSPSSVYRELRDARSQARNNEREALASGQSTFINPHDWTFLLEQAPIVLQTQSKDLEVTTWLIEALARVHGFTGIATGYKIARQLIEQYGEDLYPRPDEEGIVSQIISIVGLNGLGGEGTLIAPIRAIPLTGTDGTSVGPFASWHCEQAFEIERISDPAKREIKLEQGGAARSEIDQAISETPDVFLQKLHSGMEQAIEEYKLFQDVLNVHCVDDPQPTSKILELLENSLQTLKYIADDKLVVYDELADDEKSESDDETSAKKSSIVDNREAALKSLRDVAAYFRRTEPHSPISYAIEQAVYWSQLPLPVLIQELIPDEGARRKYQNLTGIRKVGED